MKQEPIDSSSAESTYLDGETIENFYLENGNENHPDGRDEICDSYLSSNFEEDVSIISSFINKENVNEFS